MFRNDRYHLLAGQFNSFKLFLYGISIALKSESVSDVCVSKSETVAIFSKLFAVLTACIAGFIVFCLDQ